MGLVFFQHLNSLVNSSRQARNASRLAFPVLTASTNCHRTCTASYTDVNGVPYTDQAGNVLLIDSYAVTTYDALADNKELTKETDTFVSWSEVNPWGDIEK